SDAAGDAVATAELPIMGFAHENHSRERNASTCSRVPRRRGEGTKYRRGNLAGYRRVSETNWTPERNRVEMAQGRNSMTFRALVTDKTENGKVVSKIVDVEEGDLPEGNVLVGIDWAGFNYKDGMVLHGLGGMVRSYPHVGGV